jgi:hypothetical protein
MGFKRSWVQIPPARDFELMRDDLPSLPQGAAISKCQFGNNRSMLLQD